MKRINTLPPGQRRGFKVEDFCNTFGPSRAVVFRMIKEGKLRTVKIGGSRIIPAEEGERLLREGCPPLEWPIGLKTPAPRTEAQKLSRRALSAAARQKRDATLAEAR